MLDSMRRAAQTWVAKLLFGILVFSFGIWGVADVFRGWGQGSIAKVGGVPISAEEFNRAYQQELDQISRQANKRITAEQGRALGLDRRVINQLVGGAAIEHHAERLGLNLSDQTLVDMVASDPSFKGADGKFSRDGFTNFLRQIGMSEQGFLRLKRRDELRSELIGAFVKGQTVPKPMLETLYAYNQEKRAFEYLNIDAEKAVTVPDPDEAKLKERYEADKAKYMTPEYRKFEALFLSLDDIKKAMTIPDDEIAAEYEKTKDSYNVPEKRRVQQIAFKDKTAAEVARKALLDGSKTFGDIAKEAGAKDNDVDLGLITKGALIDPKIADVAFSIEKDKVSDVVEGRFATVLLRVTQIEPGTTRTLADVKDQVTDKLATAKARAQIQEKHDEIDDARNAGKSLKEIADTMKLTYKEVASADRKGLAPDGKSALEHPDARKIMDLVFSPDAGTDQPAGELGDGSYVWVNNLSTEPPKQKPFEEVKDDVKAQYMASERTRLVSELAMSLVGRINNGEPMSAIEQAAGGSVQKTDAVTRTTIPQGLSEAAVAQGFALGLHKAGTAESADKQTRTIIRVAEITPAPTPAQADLDKIAREMSPDLANQSLVEYTEALKQQLGASINQAELKRLLGSSEE